MTTPRLSVVMPAYNEEAAVADAVEDVRRHVFGLVPDAELVVVNDGSRDATGAILDRLATEAAWTRHQGRPEASTLRLPLSSQVCSDGAWPTSGSCGSQERPTRGSCSP